MSALITVQDCWEIATGSQQDIVDYLSGLTAGAFSVIQYIRSGENEFSVLVCKIKLPIQE